MLLTNKKVAIVGGGPGGLTLARLLQLQGVSVKVYERDADQYVRQQGATLDLHYESGLKALREAGLMEEFRQAYRPGAERETITDNNLTVHYTELNEAPLQDLDSEYARPEIDRGPLRDLLIGSLAPGTVIWDSRFSGMTEKGTGWELAFENGTTAYADLVVAADGANSKVRKYLTDIDRFYSGISIVEGNVYNASVNAPQLWKLTGGGKVFAFWNGKMIVLSAKGEGSLSFYTSTKETAEWIATPGIDFKNKDQVFEWFKERFSDWSVEWHEIFSTDQSYFVSRPQYYFPADQSWQTRSNLTMLGDAAHQTPPAGEGVNQAMWDALDLYEALCLSNFNNIQDAIGSFEQKMLTRMKSVTQETETMIEGMHTKDNLAFTLSFFNDVRAVV